MLVFCFQLREGSDGDAAVVALLEKALDLSPKDVYAREQLCKLYEEVSILGEQGGCFLGGMGDGNIRLGGEGGGYSFVDKPYQSSHLTIDHAFLSRWSAVPTLDRDASNI